MGSQANVLPASAGMILLFYTFIRIAQGAPRIRGDDPIGHALA